MRQPWTISLLVLTLAVTAGAAEKDRVDATQVRCGDFATRSREQQRRLLAFLEGYARRDIAASQIGEIQVGGQTAGLDSACAREPEATVWSKVRENMGDESSGNPERTGRIETGPGEEKTSPPRAKPLELTCEEFNRLETKRQPEVLFWLDGYDRTDGSAVVDLERGLGGYESACRASPRQSLWTALEPTLANP